MAQTLADAARKLNSHNARNDRQNAVPRLILIVDDRQEDPVALAGRLPAGAAVLLRPYAVTNAEDLGRRLAAVCRRRKVRFLVSEDSRLATRLGADGLHLPERMARGGCLAVALGWRRGKAGRLLSVACHGAAALVRARRLGADLVLMSPVFPTRSHPGQATLGPHRLAGLVRASALPVLALGGVTAQTARGLAASGVRGVAAIDGFQSDFE